MPFEVETYEPEPRRAYVNSTEELNDTDTWGQGEPRDALYGQDGHDAARNDLSSIGSLVIETVRVLVGWS